jgi:hypothetical protein
MHWHGAIHHFFFVGGGAGRRRLTTGSDFVAASDTVELSADGTGTFTFPWSVPTTMLPARYGELGCGLWGLLHLSCLSASSSSFPAP